MVSANVSSVIMVGYYVVIITVNITDAAILLFLQLLRSTRATKGLSTLVAENGNFVSGNRRFCCRKQQQSRLFPYKVAVFDN